MNCPTVFNVSELKLWSCESEVSPGQWEMARPLGLQGILLMHRLRIAWLIFSGRMDAVKWVKQP